MTTKPRLRLVDVELSRVIPLSDRFTVADLLMSSVLGIPREHSIITSRPALVAYRERCFARPARQKALADHMASFDEDAGPRPQPGPQQG